MTPGSTAKQETCYNSGARSRKKQAGRQASTEMYSATLQDVCFCGFPPIQSKAGAELFFGTQTEDYQ